MHQPPKAKNRERGYFASKEGLEKLNEKKFEKNHTYETIANEAGLSIDTVKRIFKPNLGYKVQIDTIEKIARVLDLTPMDISHASPENPLLYMNQPLEASIVVFQRELETQITEDKAMAEQLLSSTPLDSLEVKRQEMLSNIEVTSNLEVGDLAQKVQRGSSVEQKMVTDLKAENIKLGNLTQES